MVTLCLSNLCWFWQWRHPWTWKFEAWLTAVSTWSGRAPSCWQTFFSPTCRAVPVVCTALSSAWSKINEPFHTHLNKLTWKSLDFFFIVSLHGGMKNTTNLYFVYFTTFIYLIVYFLFKVKFNNINSTFRVFLLYKHREEDSSELLFKLLEPPGCLWIS